MRSRELILARIRAAVAGAEEVERSPHVSRSWHGSQPIGELISLFAERVRDYKASVRIVPVARAASAVAEAVAGRQRIVAPADLACEWLTPGIETLPDQPLANLDTVDGVVTGCAVAVAETGTLVLDAGLGQGPRALSLVPDYHLCLVRADQIVPDVPQAMERLDARRPLTWISGPSATSDIELDRVEGVHGPRSLDVLVLT